jgi:hypothetical protein
LFQPVPQAGRGALETALLEIHGLWGKTKHAAAELSKCGFHRLLLLQADLYN